MKKHCYEHLYKLFTEFRNCIIKEEVFQEFKDLSRADKYRRNVDFTRDILYHQFKKDNFFLVKADT